jgi:hypothetical protein
MGHLNAMKQEPTSRAAMDQAANAPADERPAMANKKVPETGGPAGPEPTRYGDWERGGRCVDF